MGPRVVEIKIEKKNQKLNFFGASFFVHSPFVVRSQISEKSTQDLSSARRIVVWVHALEGVELFYIGTG